LIGTPVTDLATDIADADAQVVTSEGVITALIGTPLAVTVSQDIRDVSSLIGVPCVTLASDIAGIGVPDTAGTAAGLLAVPAADSALNVIATDVIGNKTDTVLGDSLVAMSKSITLGVSLVKAVTDLIPDAGALTSLAQDLTVAKTGADGDTLETLSDQLDGISTATDKLDGETVNGVATENWNAAEQIVELIGTAGTKNKLHSFLLSMNNLTAAAVITIRMYIKINATERKIYQTTKTVGTDPDGVIVVASTFGIHDVLKITVQSNTAADDGKAINFSYVQEAM
jgi:hypothetical protein